MSGSPERPRGPGIDVDVGGFRLDVGAGVEVPHHPIEQRGPTGTVSAAGAGAPELHGGERAVALHPCLEPHVAGRPISDGEERLLAGEYALHRPGRLLCQQRGDDRVLARLELAAEAAAHVVTDHAHLGERHPQRAGHSGLHAVDALRRFPHRQLVAVPLGHGSVRLHRRVDLALGAVLLFQHDIGFREARCHVAPLVGAGFGDPVAVVVDQRGVGIQGLTLVRHERQPLVLDLDGPHCVPRLVWRFGRHGRHGLSFVTAARVEQPLPDELSVRSGGCVLR